MHARLKKLIRFFMGNSPCKPAEINPVLLKFPPMVMIDTTTRCNLACHHCPNKQFTERQGFVGDMDVELYRKIIDEIAQACKNTIVRPFDGGEPFMRKDIGMLIRYAKDRGIRHVSINTNGLLLNRDRNLEIIDSGLDHVEISIDAATADTYRMIRGSDRYELLMENIQQLLELRVEMNSHLKVSVSFVRQEMNKSEVHLFRELWKGRVDRVYIREWHQHNRLIEGASGEKNENECRRHPCPYLWDRLIIHHDGRVRFCESDWACNHPVGDVTQQSITQIWNGEMYSSLRESHLRCEFDHPFCRDCSDWRVVIW
jgi:MoaA/NifB/PqqE/SkfB family radical SAM enzyme